MSPEEMDLPDDLRSLDEELSSIRYEERPSFGPELRAELARAWATRPPARPVWPRYLAAAALAGVLLVGAAVPSARASLVKLLDVFDGAEPAAATPVVEPTVDPPPVLEPEALEPVAEEPVATPPRPERRTRAPVALALEPAPVDPPVRPRMIDRAAAQAMLREVYPEYLQRAKVGGTVWLRVWVDTRGRSLMPNVVRSSGVIDLDRAALDVAPRIRFEPAMQGGTAVSTWIEFPVLFNPDEVLPEEPAASLPAPAEDPLRLPIVHPDERWQFEQPLDLRALPAWRDRTAERITPIESALVDAIGDPIVRRSLGPIESILSGMAPTGRPPAEWRAAATDVLEAALERAPANPAPLLALGRIRLRQGLRTEARMLYEQGLQIAIQDGTMVTPSLIAELHFERAKLIRDQWLASRGVGRVHAYAFEEAHCLQARAYGRSSSGYASVERLIGWNYLCPVEMSMVFQTGFEPRGQSLADLSLMMASFRATVAADPGHPGANTAMLLTLAEEKRWEDVLAGARRFVRNSDGHPHGLLLAGLALHRLGRTAESAVHFEQALERLPAYTAESIRDLGFVIEPRHAAEYRRLWGDERQAWERAFWAARDRTPDNGVNEREVEHVARSTYAYLRWGGTTSDPGEVWVRFGSPHHVHIVDDGAGHLTEFWDYGNGPDITFVRLIPAKTMDLTPEGRAYVDDLGRIFPQQ